MIRPTPAIVTQAGARRLPRWALLGLCLAYILPGFVGREPWKTADVAAYGIMRWMANGEIDWWQPLIPGQLGSMAGQLPHWLGALLMMAWPAQADWLHRLPSMLALACTLYFTWHAVFRFALLGPAQPVTFAFGGQAQPVDYARALADSGLLALMACLGLAQLAHEATPDVFLTTGISAVLYASARLAHGDRVSTSTTLACWVGGLLVLGLSGMPWLTLVVATAVPAWLAWDNLARSPRTNAEVNSQADSVTPHLLPQVAGLATLSVSAILWWTAPWTAPESQGGFTTLQAGSFLKMLVWFTWPVWPLAAWTCWRWKHLIRQAHIALPLIFITLIALSSAVAGGSDRVMMLALPALAVLAAFALPTLTRHVSALIDWFSVLFFSFCATVVWVIWIAMLTGTPAKPAANVARLAPGFEASFDGWAFAVALAASLGWLGVVAWRVTRHPPAIWKSMVLPATGVTLCWLLLMTLWLPLLDHGRSYGPLAKRLAKQLPPETCLATLGLNTAQLAGLAHQGGITLDRKPHGQSPCQHLVASPLHPDVSRLPQEGWQLTARFNRLTDNKESLLLYRRAPAAQPLADVLVSEDVN